MNFVNPGLLIDPVELAGRLGEPNLRIFDATVFLVPGETGYRAESGLDRYREGHIPGAAFMDLIRTFADTSTGLGFTLPSDSELGAAIGAAGIGPDDEVVVYSSGHMMWATRAFWMLHHAGHEHVRVLNGGLAAWRAGEHAVETGDQTYPPSSFTVRARPGLFVDLAGMQEAMATAGTCTVNALSPEVYAGTGNMHYGRRGHIPGSLNLHYEALLEDGRYRSADAVRDALASAGLLDAPRVVAYCGGGISATIDAFACLLLGHSNVAVYDGSMSEWVRNPDLPLTVGELP